jgi:S-formylglutathione hydrolase FrmB
MNHRLLIGLLVAACSSSTPQPPVVSREPAPPATTKGTVVTERFASAALGVSKNVVVYLPAGYDTAPDRRWPVFYYLHGLGGNETNWTENGKLDAAANALGLQAIVVMPDGDNAFYLDSQLAADYDACIKDGAGMLFPEQPRLQTCVKQLRYATYITQDLIGWVDRTYRTIATREGRAIAGLSMGGFGALQLGMRHPDLFAAVASHSGVDALLYAGPFPYERGKVQTLTDVSQWGGKLGPLGAWMRALLGPDLAAWRAVDPAVLVENVEQDRPALYLDVGTEDEFLLHNGAQLVHDLLVARSIEHTWYIGPGHHTFDFWAKRVPVSLGFLRDHVAKPQ